MPKMKTRSAAKKRFKKVGGSKSIKIKRGKAFRRHLLTSKSRKTKRDLRGVAYVSKADFKHILGLLPY
ncbi:MAG: 50S ribosomal protein L35 [Candidatus Dependentiae bacterium]|nr:50S ribosomal protein L35 [Candidatus Dependentiae bacterium]